jgi:hypothetical protein
MSRQQSGLPGIYNNTFPAAYEQYNTQYGGQIEAIGWKWWDTQDFVTAATVQLTGFFNVRATVDLSNMEVAFQLAAPKAFLVRAIRVYYKRRPQMQDSGAAAPTNFASEADDVAQIMNTGVMELTIGNKIYSQEPLWALTSGGGPAITWSQAGAEAANITANYGQAGIADPRAVNTMSKPLFIAPQINFSARMFWPAVLTVSATTSITLCLDGDLLRPVQ